MTGVKLLNYTPVADHMGDATNCCGLAQAPNGNYLVSFNDRGDSAAGSIAYILRSTDKGKTWAKTPEYSLPGKGLAGISIILSNLPDGSVLKSECFTYHVSKDRKAVWQPRTGIVKLYRNTNAAATEWKFVQELSLEGGLIAPHGKSCKTAQWRPHLSGVPFRTG